MAMRLDRILATSTVAPSPEPASAVTPAATSDGVGRGVEAGSSGGRPGRRLKVDITSDFLCPFCMLGVKQFQQAVTQYNALHPSTPLDPQLRFLPYQLSPDLPLGPSEKNDAAPIPRGGYLRRKFGEQKALAIEGVTKEKMREMGYEDLPPTYISSTHLPHRLLTHSLLHRPASHVPLAIDIFEAHHIRGHAPSDRNVLASLGVKHGLFANEQDALVWLSGDELDFEVKRAYANAGRVGVTGVPFWVVEGRWAVSGAIGVDGFVKLFEDVIRREDASPAPSSIFLPSVSASTSASASNSTGASPSPTSTAPPHRWDSLVHGGAGPSRPTGLSAHAYGYSYGSRKPSPLGSMPSPSPDASHAKAVRQPLSSMPGVEEIDYAYAQGKGSGLGESNIRPFPAGYRQPHSHAAYPYPHPYSHSPSRLRYTDEQALRGVADGDEDVDMGGVGKSQGNDHEYKLPWRRVSSSSSLRGSDLDERDYKRGRPMVQPYESSLRTGSLPEVERVDRKPGLLEHNHDHDRDRPNGKGPHAQAINHKHHHHHHHHHHHRAVPVPLRHMHADGDGKQAEGGGGDARSPIKTNKMARGHASDGDTRGIRSPSSSGGSAVSVPSTRSLGLGAASGHVLPSLPSLPGLSLGFREMQGMSCERTTGGIEI